MQINQAENIAVQALQHMAANPEELTSFFSITGFSPDDLQNQENMPGFFIAILEFYVNHEPALLALSASIGASPKDVVLAYKSLGGSSECVVAGGY